MAEVDIEAGAERLREAGTALSDAVDAAVGPWIRRVVTERLGVPPSAEVEEAISNAATRARDQVVNRLRDLLALDIDEQWTNPLAVLRTLVPYPTEILSAAGVPPAERDDDARRLWPDDLYDLAPATFADLGPEVHEPGIVWGATKAHLHLQKRKLRESA